MNIKNTTWNYPTSIHFGPGNIRLLPSMCAQLGINKPLLITDNGLANSDFIGETVAMLNGRGYQCQLYSKVQSNPTGTNVDGAVGMFADNCHDGIVAVGGGSALDVAKAVALIAHQQQPLWSLGGDAFDWSTIDASDIVPLIAVPTTAGTGSEVGRCSVITHEISQSKKIIFHDRLMPPVVISDPELTCGLPPAITAATGIDAFVHCFEAFCAPGFHPMADGIALEGMRLIAGALPRAFSDGNDLEARGLMLTAATMGATAFQKDLGAVHALAHSIGAVYNVHHGLANAILLPYVMVANRSVVSRQMLLLGRVLDITNPDFDSVLEWVLNFRSRLGIAHTLQDIGVPTDNIDDIGRRAQADSCAPGNPITLTADQYTAIFANALTGRLEPV